MTLAIKYCGGCNSNFERGVIAEKLLTDFPGLDIITGMDLESPGAKPPCFPGAVVVVCGCARSCATHRHLFGGQEKFIVSASDDYSALRNWLSGKIRQPE